MQFLQPQPLRSNRAQEWTTEAQDAVSLALGGGWRYDVLGKQVQELVGTFDLDRDKHPPPPPTTAEAGAPELEDDAWMCDLETFQQRMAQSVEERIQNSRTAPGPAPGPAPAKGSRASSTHRRTSGSGSGSASMSSGASAAGPRPPVGLHSGGKWAEGVARTARPATSITGEKQPKPRIAFGGRVADVPPHAAPAPRRKAARAASTRKAAPSARGPREGHSVVPPSRALPSGELPRLQSQLEALIRNPAGAGAGASPPKRQEPESSGRSHGQLRALVDLLPPGARLPGTPGPSSSGEGASTPPRTPPPGSSGEEEPGGGTPQGTPPRGTGHPPLTPEVSDKAWGGSGKLKPVPPRDDDDEHDAGKSPSESPISMPPRFERVEDLEVQQPSPAPAPEGESQPVQPVESVERGDSANRTSPEEDPENGPIAAQVGPATATAARLDIIGEGLEHPLVAEETALANPASALPELNAEELQEQLVASLADTIAGHIMASRSEGHAGVTGMALEAAALEEPGMHPALVHPEGMLRHVTRNVLLEQLGHHFPQLEAHPPVLADAAEEGTAEASNAVLETAILNLVLESLSRAEATPAADPFTEVPQLDLPIEPIELPGSPLRSPIPSPMVAESSGADAQEPSGAAEQHAAATSPMGAYGADAGVQTSQELPQSPFPAPFSPVARVARRRHPRHDAATSPNDSLVSDGIASPSVIQALGGTSTAPSSPIPAPAFKPAHFGSIDSRLPEPAPAPALAPGLAPMPQQLQQVPQDTSNDPSAPTAFYLANTPQGLVLVPAPAPQQPPYQPPVSLPDHPPPRRRNRHPPPPPPAPSRPLSPPPSPPMHIETQTDPMTVTPPPPTLAKRSEPLLQLPPLPPTPPSPSSLSSSVDDLRHTLKGFLPEVLRRAVQPPSNAHDLTLDQAALRADYARMLSVPYSGVADSASLRSTLAARVAGALCPPPPTTTSPQAEMSSPEDDEAPTTRRFHRWDRPSPRDASPGCHLNSVPMRRERPGRGGELSTSRDTFTTLTSPGSSGSDRDWMPSPPPPSKAVADMDTDDGDTTGVDADGRHAISPSNSESPGTSRRRAPPELGAALRTLRQGKGRKRRGDALLWSSASSGSSTEFPLTSRGNKSSDDGELVPVQVQEIIGRIEPGEVPDTDTAKLLRGDWRKLPSTEES
ncbi:hypothetical protein CYMTET_36481 [Cymbomonas tetramitiformis]|uniref:Uncharacterized protein n=1 Tax=Cymbomonas tetramitiformis TaxID=36881 RepID=A0AAE0F768_9CHLO|nr:hypothetical protein CYMTET_36481 [Cymbomonas tetramitiformis]